MSIYSVHLCGGHFLERIPSGPYTSPMILFIHSLSYVLLSFAVVALFAISCCIKSHYTDILPNLNYRECWRPEHARFWLGHVAGSYSWSYYRGTSSCSQGADSIKRYHLTSIWNPIVEIRRSYDRLISTMGFPILVRWHFYIESGPKSKQLIYRSGSRRFYLWCPIYKGVAVTWINYWSPGE